MRAFITALLLFFILIGLIIINSVYITSEFENMSLAAERIASSQDKEALILELKRMWQKNLPIFNLSIRMGELERMNDLIESLSASHHAENDAELRKYCILISDLAKELALYEKLSLRSIF